MLGKALKRDKNEIPVFSVELRKEYGPHAAQEEDGRWLLQSVLISEN